jgi:hypothetical protein
MANLAKNFNNLGIEINDNEEHVLIRVLHPDSGLIMSMDELKKLKKAMHEDMSSKNMEYWQNNVLKQKFFLGEIIGGEQFKTTLQASKDENGEWGYKEGARNYHFEKEALGMDKGMKPQDREGAIKLTLENEDLLDFIKDDVLNKIQPDHEIKTLRDDQALLSKASLLA